MTVTTEIETLKAKVSSLPSELTWRQSLLDQLNYCAGVVSGAKSPERLEQLTMGFIALRELEGEKWAESFPSLQLQLQQLHLSYAAKVRLGIHRRA